MVYSIVGDSLEFVGIYGEFGDNAVTWGVSVKGDVLVLSLVNNLLGIPYDSNIGGIRLLRWRDLTSSSKHNFLSESDIRIYPNLTFEYLTIDLSKLQSQIANIKIFSSEGRLVGSKESFKNLNHLSVQDLNTGIYFLQIESQNRIGQFKFIKN